MRKRTSARSAFTLIEVMVAVMIVSVVIAALLEMQGNASNKFMQIKKIMKNSQYSSFLLSERERYGFERSSSDMRSLLGEFEVESDLRRRLSAMKITVEYEMLDSIDTSKILGTQEQSDMPEGRIVEGAQSAGVVFEIGKTLLATQDFKSGLIRVRIR